MKVFLGGTVAGSKWRDYVMPLLKVDYFNPVVEEWTEEARLQEIYEREHCDFNLYVLTPHMEGYYAIAEVIDDSFKKTDKTIYCYLPVDGDKRFNDKQITELERIGKKVIHNGGVWKRSLDDVIVFLNSAAQTKEDIGVQDGFNDVFISYGRRHSVAFARKLHNRLKSRNYNVWFDMNDIPVGVDFQEQIDNGIRKAHNFVFVISPHSVKSIYCLKEIMLALKYGKRIIPILHVEPTDCWDKVNPAISKLNWIYMRQEEKFSVPLEEWSFIDDFDKKFEELISVLEQNKQHVWQHTHFLDSALNWTNTQFNSRALLSGEERKKAEEWLLKKSFTNNEGVQISAPCHVIDLQAEYICESRKNGENLNTDVFLLYDRADFNTKEKVRFALNHFGITTWSDTTDIQSGVSFESAIEVGIEQATNIVMLISKQSLNSKYCQKEYAKTRELNKRIIPMLIEPLEFNIDDKVKNVEILKNFPNLFQIQYIDFTDQKAKEEVEVKSAGDVKADLEARKEKSPYEKAVDKLVAQINFDKRYYEQHKIFLVQALKWVRSGNSDSMLLRGYNLENALAWQKLSAQKEYKLTSLHNQFIESSIAKAGTLSSEVFISYSRKDSDFARKLNTELQVAGKTTWFDQESIASSVDFQAEIYKGIENSHNFVFIISPNSINSAYCADEVNYAAERNKRFITLLYDPIDPDTMPKALAAVQWIDFDTREFSEAFPDLIRTLDTDREYVEQHTRMSQRAREWEMAGKSKDLLIRGNEMNNANNWLRNAQQTNKKPEPTNLQREFITTSYEIEAKSTQRRQRKIVLATAAIAIAVLGFGIFALIQMQAARNLLAQLKQEQYESAMAQGDRFFREQQYDLAIEEYKSAEQVFQTGDLNQNAKVKMAVTKEAKILFAKADSLLQSGEINYLAVLDVYKVTERFDPVNSQIKMNELNKRIAETIKYYKNVASLFIKANEIEDAKLALELARKLSSDDDPEINDMLNEISN